MYMYSNEISFVNTVPKSGRKITFNCEEKHFYSEKPYTGSIENVYQLCF